MKRDFLVGVCVGCIGCLCWSLGLTVGVQIYTQRSVVKTPQKEVSIIFTKHVHYSEISKEHSVQPSEKICGITPEQYDYVVRVVMGESGNQSIDGQMAVAQCIQNTANATGMDIYEVVTQPKQYTSPYQGELTSSVVEACMRVFINGEKVVNENIRWFYNPSNGYSAWHESKTYVTTIGAHRFFA